MPLADAEAYIKRIELARDTWRGEAIALKDEVMRLERLNASLSQFSANVVREWNRSQRLLANGGNEGKPSAEAR